MIPANYSANYTGQILISAPSLCDINFHQTVILMLEGAPSQSAMGVVLNRLTDRLAEDLWREAFQRPLKSALRLRVGGPVFGPVAAIHTLCSFGEREIFSGIYISTDRDHLDELVTRGANEVQIFIGYAGWGEGQLEREIEEGSWFWQTASPEIIFDNDHSTLWQRMLHAAGKEQLTEILHRQIPLDAGNN